MEYRNWIKHHIQVGNRDDGDGTHTYYIKVDGNEIHSVDQPNRISHENMKIFVADPWYETAQGSLKNILITDGTKGIN